MALSLFFKLSLGILLLSLIIGYINFSTYTFYEKDLESDQKELKLTEKTQVLDKDGKLTQVGWTRSRENLLFDPSRINPSTSYFKFINKLRYKKWEAFIIIHKDFILGTALFDISYIGGWFLHFCDMSNKDSKIILNDEIFISNKPYVADECCKNCLVGNFTTMDFSYNQVKTDKPNDQFIKIFRKDPKGELSIDMDLKIHGKSFDSLVTLNPISSDSTLFYYNEKINTLSATGKIIINNKEYNSKDLIISYDNGRGVWPVRSGWFWVNANGKIDESTYFGLNLGHGFNENSASKQTEDCFFINGRLFKLNAVKTVEEEIITENKIKMSKWTFSSEINEKIKNKCNIEFIPLRKYDKGIDLKIIKDSFVLHYGLFTGTCINIEGKEYKFNIYGLVEKKTSIW